MDSLAIELAKDYVGNILLMVEAAKQIKQALTLSWFLGNISMIILFGYSFFIFFLSRKKIKTTERKTILKKIVPILFPLGLVAVIVIKINTGTLVAVLLLLCLSFAFFAYAKWDKFFKRSEENRVPIGWMFLLVFIFFINGIVFNTFPGILINRGIGKSETSITNNTSHSNNNNN